MHRTEVLSDGASSGGGGSQLGSCSRKVNATSRTVDCSALLRLPFSSRGVALGRIALTGTLPERRAKLDLKRIVTELKLERDRLGQAIAVLESLDSAKALVGLNAAGYRSARRTMRKRGRITPQGRKRLSELMKKRWAERRRRVALNQRK